MERAFEEGKKMLDVYFQPQNYELVAVKHDVFSAIKGDAKPTKLTF
jgi:hypothetical protein